MQSSDDHHVCVCLQFPVHLGGKHNRAITANLLAIRPLSHGTAELFFLCTIFILTSAAAAEERRPIYAFHQISHASAPRTAS